MGSNGDTDPGCDSIVRSRQFTLLPFLPSILPQDLNFIIHKKST